MNTLIPITEEKIYVKDKAIKDKKAIVRSDTGTVLGVVSNRYELFKHEDVLDSINTVAGKLNLIQPEPNFYKEGAVMHADYYLNEVKEIASSTVGDTVKFGVRVMNSYDGSFKLSYLLVAFRLVCSNGLVLPKTIRSFSIKHFKSNANKFTGEDIFNRLNVSLNDVDKIVSNYDTWAQMKVNIPEVNHFLLTEFGKRESKNLIEYYNNCVEENTVWGLYNVLTKYVTHETQARKNNVNNLGLLQHRKGLSVTNRIEKYFSTGI